MGKDATCRVSTNGYGNRLLSLEDNKWEGIKERSEELISKRNLFNVK